MPDPKTLKATSGVIAIGAHQPEEVAWLKRHSRCVVFADFAPPDDSVDAVHSNLTLATRKMLAALGEAGYLRIGFIGWWDGGQVGVTQAKGERGLAYIAWQTEQGRYDPDLCLFDRNTEESGYHLTRQIMAQPNRPDALIAGNDNMAVGAYRALHEMGLRIPEDVAVASFNDISVAQFLNPPLTTVHLPSEQIGETAVDQMLELIQGRKLAKRTTLASRIIWRGSVRRPKG